MSKKTSTVEVKKEEIKAEVQEEKNFLAHFLDFIKDQGVVVLAIGFILGGAVTKVVSSLVSDLINPLLGIVLGVTDGLAEASVTIAGAELKWGNFVSVLIDFVVVASVVYLLAHLLKLDKIIKKK